MTTASTWAPEGKISHGSDNLSYYCRPINGHASSPDIIMYLAFLLPKEIQKRHLYWVILQLLLWYEVSSLRDVLDHSELKHDFLIR